MLLQGRNQCTCTSQLLGRLKTVNPTWRSCVETFEDELLGVANQNNGPLNVRLRKMGAWVAYHTKRDWKKTWTTMQTQRVAS